jgi:hypothetical protein
LYLVALHTTLEIVTCSSNSFLAIALAFAGSAGAQEVIKIGHVGPVSGPSAHLGKDNENGAKMASKD